MFDTELAGDLNSGNYRNLVDSSVGIGFGTLKIEFMKFSGKDILLVFGIIVAIIVTLTTMAYSEQSASLPKMETPVKKASLQGAAVSILKKTLEQVRQ